MTPYIELVQLVESPAFRKRIQYALWAAAVDVLNDAQSSAGKKEFARKALRGAADTDVLYRLAIRCAANPAIAQAGEAATDSDISFVVAGAFDSLIN